MTHRDTNKPPSFDVSDLNPAQQAAVMHDTGPLLVLAGAGSGKTKTLVYRLARLVNDGVDPQRILLLTFTRKSSQEMMRRAAQLVDSRCQRVTGGTFHSFCTMVLHRFASVLGYPNGFTILDRGDAEQLMGLVRKQGGPDTQKRFPKKNTLLDIVSKSINTNRSIETVIIDDYPQFEDLVGVIEAIAHEYHHQKSVLAVMDYDDLLVKTTQAITQNEDVGNAVANQYQYVLVDEFQDSNHIQLALIKGILRYHSNIMVVGDDAQSIYGFRGADVTNILSFERQFEDVSVVELATNYRSVQPILDLSNAVINASDRLYKKQLTAARDGDTKPRFVEAFDDTEQSDFVVDRLLGLREEGVPLTAMAVLFRSSSHANQLELALSAANIPYKKFGGLKFTEAAHVKDVLAYIKVMVNPQDTLNWHRLFQLFEGVGPKLSQTLVAYQQSHHHDFLGMDYAPFKTKAAYSDIRQLAAVMADPGSSPSDTVDRVLKHYRPILKRCYDDAHRRDNDLQSLRVLSDAHDSLQDMLDVFSLDPPESSQVGVEPMGSDDEYVTLSTIHSAKGLEWSRVFVLSVVDGYIPSIRSMHDPAQLDEERRLLYVAMTRAKDELYVMKPNLSDPGSYYSTGGMAFSQASRFLTAEMIDRYCDTWSIGGGTSGPRYTL